MKKLFLLFPLFAAVSAEGLADDLDGVVSAQEQSVNGDDTTTVYGPDDTLMASFSYDLENGDDFDHTVIISWQAYDDAENVVAGSSVTVDVSAMSSADGIVVAKVYLPDNCSSNYGIACWMNFVRQDNGQIEQLSWTECYFMERP